LSYEALDKILGMVPPRAKVAGMGAAAVAAGFDCAGCIGGDRGGAGRDLLHS